MLGVPLLGAALNTINHRLGESAIGLTLDGASLVILDARLETDTAQTADLARSVRHKAQESGIPVVLIAGTPRQAGEHRYEDVLVPDTRLPHPTFGEREHRGVTAVVPRVFERRERALIGGVCHVGLGERRRVDFGVCLRDLGVGGLERGVILLGERLRR